MPYIQAEARPALDKRQVQPETAGELNYVITQLVFEFARLKGRNYQTYAEIEGVLQHVSKEVYRRSAAPYEDLKIAENGDAMPRGWR